ncbi:helix-turn-helix domain-containing protein [Brenneria alni]|nr:helix-turn-helix domain-containing protein [Brenneria alni]
MIDQDIIYLEKVDYGKIRWMPLDVAMRIVTAYQRFDDVLKIVNFRFQLLVNHCVDNSGDSISVVEKTLRSLNQLPPDVRQRFTALTYLSQYTSLSKSTINRVLKRLQHDGMIALDRGRLIQFSDIRTDEQT